MKLARVSSNKGSLSRNAKRKRREKIWFEIGFLLQAA